MVKRILVSLLGKKINQIRADIRFMILRWNILGIQGKLNILS